MQTRAAPGVESSLPLRGSDGLLCVTLSFYWAYLYFRVLLPPPDESELVYVITVAPVSAAAAFGLLSHLVRGELRLANVGSATGRLELALLSLVSLVIFVSLARWDVASIRSIGLLALTLLWLARVHMALSLQMLNAFFAASIVAGGCWFLLGFSEYGLIPGQYFEGADRGIEWRVSLFPFVPESGFFALIVLLANQLHNRGRTRLLFCAASVYFIIFSGIRSALVALVLAEVFIFFNSKLRTPAARTTLILLLLAAFVASIFIASQLSVMPTLSGGAIENYLFRTESFNDPDLALGHTAYRGWLWVQHVGLFASSPWTGIGTFDFATVVGESLIEGMDNSGSESFITSWLARLGLCFLPFMVFLWLLCRRLATEADGLAGGVFIVLGVAALAYGSFLVPYNFMFIVLFALLLQGRFRSPKSRKSPRRVLLREEAV